MFAATDAAGANHVSMPVWGWLAFVGAISALLLVDLLVLHRNAKVPSFRRALAESAGWITLGVTFGLVVAAAFGVHAAGEYYAGYLIEKSLSIDNVFVWALILRYFTVPREYQHRVLFWGVFAALGLRAAFIFGGVAILDRLEWVLYLFGAFLLFTAVRLLVTDEEDMDPGSSRSLRLARRIFPSTDRYDGQKLFTRVDGRRLATPLLFVLVVIEISDVLFAVDSVPAILAVSRDQFIVFSSNALAILGLRSLYFLLADLHDRFRYLQEGLAVILAFVGLKMLLAEGIPSGLRGTWTPGWLEGIDISIALSLTIIGVVMAATIALSILRPEGEDGPADDGEGGGGGAVRAAQPQGPDSTPSTSMTSSSTRTSA
jgi:tellurite resistance protein TerC